MMTSWQLPEDRKVITEDDNLPSEGEFKGNWNIPDCEKKLIVFDSCLCKLLKRCPEFGDVIAQCKRGTTDSMLSVQLTSHSGHTINWDSQPVGKKPLGNLLLVELVIFTGNILAAINHLASCLKRQFFKEVFYDTQRKVFFPCHKWCLRSWETETNRYSKC